MRAGCTAKRDLETNRVISLEYHGDVDNHEHRWDVGKAEIQVATSVPRWA